MKYTLVSGCSTSLNIDTLALTTTDVKYVEKELNQTTLVDAFNQLLVISNYVPRPTTSYTILNLVEDNDGVETDYLLLGRAGGCDTISIGHKTLYKREGASLTLVAGFEHDVTSIDGLSI